LNFLFEKLEGGNSKSKYLSRDSGLRTLSFLPSNEPTSHFCILFVNINRLDLNKIGGFSHNVKFNCLLSSKEAEKLNKTNLPL
jgi:hypothetical protein